MPPTSTPVTICRADDPAWEEWLGPIRRDVYHTAGYHAYAQGSGEGEPFLIVVGDRRQGLAWPYLLRRIAHVSELAFSTAADIGSVYGYPGPLAWGCAPGDPFLVRAWAEIQAIWREQAAVAAFTRFHPLLGNAALAAGLRADASTDDTPTPLVTGGPTVSVDLTLGYEGVRAAYGRDLRREVNQSRRLGFTTECDEDWTELATFARLYRDTMLRLGASQYYFFDEPAFWRLRDALDGHLHLLVTRKEGTVAAAGLFTEWDGIVEWYLVGTDVEFIAQSPSKVLVDSAIEWAGARGNRVLHLGGGRGGDRDSLLWFKGRFSPRRHSFSTGRWILEPEQYADLVAARRLAAGDRIRFDPGFFPAYRASAIGSAVSDPNGSAGPGITLQIRQIRPDDADALAGLLARIDSTYFQPHPMTDDEAQRISRLSGRDIYLIGTVGNEAVAYGMLRGWDEGFKVPSLGIGVRRDSEHRGFGRAMMQALHSAARERGSSRVRLRVSPANVRAADLYRALGYREVGVERDEIVMILDV